MAKLKVEFIKPAGGGPDSGGHFGGSDLSGYGDYTGYTHEGLDMCSKVLFPVVSIADGIASRVFMYGTKKFNGLEYKQSALIVSHNEKGCTKSDDTLRQFISSYVHMRFIVPDEGDTIKAGEVIGFAGGEGSKDAPSQPGAGNTLGTHLHFGLGLRGYKNGLWMRDGIEGSCFIDPEIDTHDFKHPDNYLINTNVIDFKWLPYGINHSAFKFDKFLRKLTFSQRKDGDKKAIVVIPNNVDKRSDNNLDSLSTTYDPFSFEETYYKSLGYKIVPWKIETLPNKIYISFSHNPTKNKEIAIKDFQNISVSELKNIGLDETDVAKLMKSQSKISVKYLASFYNLKDILNEGKWFICVSSMNLNRRSIDYDSDYVNGKLVKPSIKISLSITYGLNRANKFDFDFKGLKLLGANITYNGINRDDLLIPFELLEKQMNFPKELISKLVGKTSSCYRDLKTKGKNDQITDKDYYNGVFGFIFAETFNLYYDFKIVGEKKSIVGSSQTFSLENFSFSAGTKELPSKIEINKILNNYEWVINKGKDWGTSLSSISKPSEFFQTSVSIYYNNSTFNINPTNIWKRFVEIMGPIGIPNTNLILSFFGKSLPYVSFPKSIYGYNYLTANDFINCGFNTSWINDTRNKLNNCAVKFINMLDKYYLNDKYPTEEEFNSIFANLDYSYYCFIKRKLVSIIEDYLTDNNKDTRNDRVKSLKNMYTHFISAPNDNIPISILNNLGYEITPSSTLFVFDNKRVLVAVTIPKKRLEQLNSNKNLNLQGLPEDLSNINLCDNLSNSLDTNRIYNNQYNSYLSTSLNTQMDRNSLDLDSILSQLLQTQTINSDKGAEHDKMITSRLQKIVFNSNMIENKDLSRKIFSLYQNKYFKERHCEVYEILKDIFNNNLGNKNNFLQSETNQLKKVSEPKQSESKKSDNHSSSVQQVNPSPLISPTSPYTDFAIPTPSTPPSYTPQSLPREDKGTERPTSPKPETSYTPSAYTPPSGDRTCKVNYTPPPPININLDDILGKGADISSISMPSFPSFQTQDITSQTYIPPTRPNPVKQKQEEMKDILIGKTKFGQAKGDELWQKGNYSTARHSAITERLIRRQLINTQRII